MGDPPSSEGEGERGGVGGHFFWRDAPAPLGRETGRGRGYSVRPLAFLGPHKTQGLKLTRDTPPQGSPEFTAMAVWGAAWADGKYTPIDSYGPYFPSTRGAGDLPLRTPQGPPRGIRRCKEAADHPFSAFLILNWPEKWGHSFRPQPKGDVMMEEMPKRIAYGMRRNHLPPPKNHHDDELSHWFNLNAIEW